MSNHNVPAFDAIAGSRAPFAGFGDILVGSQLVESRFWEESAAARERIRSGFGYELRCSAEIPADLDKIIEGMWQTGWDPVANDLNLFSCDFGLVLTTVIVELVGGTLIFRSEHDMGHCSLFWASSEFEVFPFHKILKCLTIRGEESVARFVNGLVERVKYH